MRVLIACEFSGTVRRAFRALGHHAYSCDLLEAEDKSPFHIQCDVREVAAGWAPREHWQATSDKTPWDLLIAHPPCTYLTNAGARWWAGREKEQDEALDFVRYLMSLPIPRKAIENPPGKIGTAIRKADQYIQPWQFGHLETKKTGLWLDNLPPLQPTHDVRAEMMKLTLAERSRVHWMPPGPDRSKERSRTYAGIAEAMAKQWTTHCLRPGSSPAGRVIGAVSWNCGGSDSDSPRSSMPSSRCSSSHSDHKLRLSGSASVAMNELCAGLLRIARKAKSAGLSAPNAAESAPRPPRSRDGACR